MIKITCSFRSLRTAPAANRGVLEARTPVKLSTDTLMLDAIISRMVLPSIPHRKHISGISLAGVINLTEISTLALAQRGERKANTQNSDFDAIWPDDHNLRPYTEFSGQVLPENHLLYRMLNRFLVSSSVDTVKQYIRKSMPG